MNYWVLSLSGLIRIERVSPKREPVSLRSLFAGIAFIRSHPVTLGAISLFESIR